MSLTCGLIGLPSCGKTVILNAVTAAGASSYDGPRLNRAVVDIPDRRLDKLVEMYRPLKVRAARLEVVDIPGLVSDATGRGLRQLGGIKDVDILIHVVRCFEDGGIPFVYETIDPRRDVEDVDLELMVADSATLESKIERLAKRVRSHDEDAVRESSDCRNVYDAIQFGTPARKQGLGPSELRSVRECNLVSLKPVLFVANINTADDSDNPHVAVLRGIAEGEGTKLTTVRGREEADISQMEADEREEFRQGLGLQDSSMERLLGAAYGKLGLISFFTTGEDEVRAWTCRKGDRAPVAAGKIHTDMEAGFIRMEVISYVDLIELGDEAAVAKAGRQRLEGSDYEVQDGDIVAVRFNK
jgi:GTP-binding protein YchF